MTSVRYYEKYPSISTVFDLFSTTPYAVFLDSSLQNKLGQYSIIGLNPYLILESKNQVVRTNGEISSESLEYLMNQQMATENQENLEELPLITGAIGYYSYDYGMEKMGVSSRHEDLIGVQEAFFCFYDCFIIEDHQKGRLAVISNGKLKETETQLNELEQLIFAQEGVTDCLENSSSHEMSVTTNMEQEAYVKAIKRVIDYIYEGDIYVMNLTRQLVIDSQIKPYELFKKLREINPSPFGGYLNYPDFQVVSSSPERFIEVKDRVVTTRPIKGTRKRGQTKEEDKALKADLENSEKEKSELLMVVDLQRNDLNKVCQAGSVKVPNLFFVEPYATVFHLVADVQGRLKDEVSTVDLLASVSPGGSITGNPKYRAMEIIDELEESRRGLYTGSMGYISATGDSDFNIIIRTAIAKEGKFHLGIGGGITSESIPLDEFEETNQKAKAIVESFRR